MVSHKQNATRRKVNAIVMNGEDQIIFIDTPGLHESGKIMNQLMVEVALKSIGDADLVLFLASVHDDTSNYEKFLSLKCSVGHILVLTKIDEVSDKKLADKLTVYSKFSKEFISLVPVSIKKNICKKLLLDEISKNLPAHPHYYDSELISTTNTKDIYRDLILEGVFDSVSSEIPYYTDVVIEKVTEGDNIIKIYAKIITDNDHHKKILIGKGADTIKRIGIRSKKLISEFTKVKVFVKLEVVVKKGWNLDKNKIKKHFIY